MVFFKFRFQSASKKVRFEVVIALGRSNFQIALDALQLLIWFQKKVACIVDRRRSTQLLISSRKTHFEELIVFDYYSVQLGYRKMHLGISCVVCHAVSALNLVLARCTLKT